MVETKTLALNIHLGAEHLGAMILWVDHVSICLEGQGYLILKYAP